MPLTEADFTFDDEPQQAPVPQAQPQAQAPGLTNATPVSQQNASLQRPHPGGLSEQFEANRLAISNLPAFLQPFAALGERYARTLDSAGRLVTDVAQPGAMAKPTGGVSDMAEVVTAFVAPEAVAMGAAGDTAARWMDADESAARWISGLAEITPLPYRQVSQGFKAAARGKAVLTSATERIAANAGESAVAKVGRQVKALTTNQITRRGHVLGQDISRIERQFGASGATLDPNNPLYSRLDANFTRAGQIGEIAGPAGQRLEAIKARFANHQPIPVSELVGLKHSLIEPARAVGKAQPSLSATAANAVKSDTTRTLSDMMPRQQALEYQGARKRYGREVGHPRKVLSRAYSDAVSPTQLFNAVFNPSDPYTMQAALELAKNRPALKSKLALGYLENLAAGTQGFQNARSAAAALKQTRGLVEGHGLVSTADLNDLEYFLRRNSIPDLVEGFQQMFGTGAGIAKGSAATGLAYLASGKPSHMVIAMTAAGALPAMRRMLLVPKGSTAWKRFAAQSVGLITKFAAQASEATQQQVEGEEELHRLMAPVHR